MCLHIFKGKRVGILPILDEELIVPQGSDKGFLSKLDASQVIYFTMHNIPRFLLFHFFSGKN